MDVVKVGVVGIAGVLLAIQFKNTKPEFSLLLTFGTCLVIFIYAISNFQAILEIMEKLNHVFADRNGYLKIILKVIGITYVCEFCAGVCKDAGYGAIANQIEVFGKLSVLCSGIPIIAALIETIQQF